MVVPTKNHPFVHRVLEPLIINHPFWGVCNFTPHFWLETPHLDGTVAYLFNGPVVTIQVWNDTVANLTLMALGSSAPEILSGNLRGGRARQHPRNSQPYKGTTLPETNLAPENPIFPDKYHQNISKWWIFHGYVSFRECINEWFPLWGGVALGRSGP